MTWGNFASADATHSYYQDVRRASGTHAKIATCHPCFCFCVSQGEICYFDKVLVSFCLGLSQWENGTRHSFGFTVHGSASPRTMTNPTQPRQGREDSPITVLLFCFTCLGRSWACQSVPCSCLSSCCERFLFTRCPLDSEDPYPVINAAALPCPR